MGITQQPTSMEMRRWKEHLELANAHRVWRANFRKELKKFSRQQAVTYIEYTLTNNDAPYYNAIRNMQIGALLTSIRSVGEKKAKIIMIKAGLPVHNKRIKDIPTRQLQAILQELKK